MLVTFPIVLLITFEKNIHIIERDIGKCCAMSSGFGGKRVGRTVNVTEFAF